MDERYKPVEISPAQGRVTVPELGRLVLYDRPPTYADRLMARQVEYERARAQYRALPWIVRAMVRIELFIRRERFVL
jgi:hypothetical protein